MRAAKINTIVDGFDVEQVNLWETPNPDNRGKMEGWAKNASPVEVLETKGDYARIRVFGFAKTSRSDKSEAFIIGWVNNGFLVYDTEKASD